MAVSKGNQLYEIYKTYILLRADNAQGADEPSSSLLVDYLIFSAEFSDLICTVRPITGDQKEEIAWNSFVRFIREKHNIVLSNVCIDFRAVAFNTNSLGLAPDSLLLATLKAIIGAAKGDYKINEGRDGDVFTLPDMEENIDLIKSNIRELFEAN